MPLLRLFAAYSRRYLARHFHAVRLSREGLPPRVDGPLVVVLNHPSWWDPLVAMTLALSAWPDRRHFAPIDAAALERYRLLGRIGLFGVERESLRGAARFLRTAKAVLARSDGAIWITAQGEFRDPRERPVRLRIGVGHLGAAISAGAIVPLAIEYPFWEERLPEALARFGAPLVAGRPGGPRTPVQWTTLIERSLEQTQDALANEARSRDSDAFETVLSGGAGVGVIYDAWRRVAARIRGERFRREHGRDGR